MRLTGFCPTGKSWEGIREGCQSTVWETNSIPMGWFTSVLWFGNVFQFPPFKLGAVIELFCVPNRFFLPPILLHLEVEDGHGFFFLSF